ncbi:hypothetical protein Agub_g6394, partial [Astrephomene gubernaculifera]
MQSVGSQPCRQGRCRELASTQGNLGRSCPLRFSYRGFLAHQPHATRPLLRNTAALPASAGDPSSSADVASVKFGRDNVGAEANGTEPSPIPAMGRVPISAASGLGSGTGGSNNHNNGGGSLRASFRSIVKGSYLGELLFVVMGSIVCGGLTQWTVGTPMRRFNPYTFHVTLPQAPGVVLGTPVRMKGVPIGAVMSTTPLVDRISVEVEVNEAKTIIPRNAKIELTQSGLIPAASIDISPPEGVSAERLTAAVAAKAAAGAATATGSSSSEGAAAGSHDAAKHQISGKVAARRAKRAAHIRLAGPKDVAACRLQGVLVCHGDRMEGQQGGSMDELMAHMLKSLRKGED